MKKPTLGKADSGAQITIHLDKLIESRALIQANSGAGKSWAIRRLCEQTHGQVQQIILDVEGEFHTLREKFDYVLAGGEDGDCPAEPRSAHLLARRLLEHRVNAIIDINALKVPQRQDFMRRFLGALDTAPRRMWHPCMIIVDEAHKFAPQSGKAESTNAVMDLMANGRKRGHCGILAVQRISKLHKDVAAEANNKLIGRAALDVDMKRSADELGFYGREQQHQLRHLKPGHFYAFGPALCDQVTQMIVGPVSTTHPKPGQDIPAPKAPGKKVMAMLAKLKDLPEAAQREAQDVAALQKELREANRQLKARPVQADEAALAKAVDQAVRQADREHQRQASEQAKAVKDLQARIQKIGSICQVEVKRAAPVAPKPWPSPAAPLSRVARAAPAPDQFEPLVDDGFKLGTPHRKILRALALNPDGLEPRVCAMRCCYVVTGGAFRNPVSALRTAGLIYPGHGLLRITEAGLELLGPVDPLPTGDDLRAWWKSSGIIGGPHGRMLDTLAEYGPMAKNDLAEHLEYEVTGGAFRNPLSKLRTLGLVSGQAVLEINADLVG